MAVISPDTFDPLRRYVAVRLQQAVPIVDADWNELDDLRRFEIRAFLKWFVGDGVPEGNDGFRIEGDGTANDFVIHGASGPPDALATAGRYLVDGLDVLIEVGQVRFVDQPLHPSQAGSAALAAALGVDEIVELGTPAGDGTVTVYLDVWERLVTPEEDPALIHPGLGTESCARMRREWVVRVRAASGAPVSGDADFAAGHSYTVLATVTRRAGIDEVAAGDVLDLRQKRLLVPPATLVEDLLDVDPVDYRSGRGRPPISLRAAINAFLRGETPATPAALLSEGPPDNEAGGAAVEDGEGNVWAFFVSERTGNRDLFLRRYSLLNRSWGVDETITTDPEDDNLPIAIADSTGEIWLLWNTERGAATPNLWVKRYRQATASFDPDLQLISSPEPDVQPVVIENSDTNLWVVWTSDRDLSKASIWRKRYLRGADTWEADSQLIVSPAPLVDRSPAAAALGDGTVLVLWQSNRDGNDQVWWSRYDAAASPLVAEQRLTVATNRERRPSLFVDSQGVAWAFWRERISNSWQLVWGRFDAAGGVWDLETPLTSGGFQNFDPTPAEDSLGNLWLFWRSQRPGGELLLYRIFNATTGVWGDELTATPEQGDYSLGRVLTDSAGAIWAFWTETALGTSQARYRRFFPVI